MESVPESARGNIWSCKCGRVNLSGNDCDGCNKNCAAPKEPQEFFRIRNVAIAEASVETSVEASVKASVKASVESSNGTTAAKANDQKNHKDVDPPKALSPEISTTKTANVNSDEKPKKRKLKRRSASVTGVKKSHKRSKRTAHDMKESSDQNVKESSTGAGAGAGAGGMTTVVHMKRAGGKVVQDCDVYIGRRMTMGGWNLPQSKWHNPFTIAGTYTA
jgi:hypothetical protein